MAISKGTSVGKPRVFIDYIAFAKAVGAEIGYTSESHASLFDMNPAKITNHATSSSGVNIPFEIFIDTNQYDIEIHKLLGTVNYFAVLGHDVLSGSGNDKYEISSFNLPSSNLSLIHISEPTRPY